MSDNILRHRRFDTRFTLYIKAYGMPVERPLSDMSKDELRAAADWHHDSEAKLIEELFRREAAEANPF
jgi:hypothetical protein